MIFPCSPLVLRVDSNPPLYQPQAMLWTSLPSHKHNSHLLAERVVEVMWILMILLAGLKNSREESEHFDFKNMV